MGDEFNLEPSAPQGEIPDRVISELRTARRAATDMSQAFADAIKAMAAQHGINARALRRYVSALKDDAVDKLDAEARALEKLIGGE